MYYCPSSVRADHQHFGVKLLNPNGHHSVLVNKSMEFIHGAEFLFGWMIENTADDKELQNKGNHTPIPLYSILKYIQATSKTEHHFACYFNMYIIWNCTLTLFCVSLQCLELGSIKFKKNKGIMWSVCGLR